jgi:putative MATE family efflux protein
MSRSEIDMLHGSLAGPLFKFAIPVALIGILQQMFNTADILVLGRFVGTGALAAVGNNAPIIGILVNLFLGISLGANVLIARFLGGGRLKEASGAIHTTILMAILTGLFILLVGQVFAGPLMVWMGVPEEVRVESERYLRIYLLGMPGMTLYDFLSAIYRSHGNVRTPLLSLLTASIVNIVGNLAAVACGFGLIGVVTVTAIANYVSSGLLIRMLRYGHGILRFYPGAIRVRMDDIKEILRVGVPAGIQGMVFNLSNLVIQSAINSEGSLAMAASAAAYVLEINTYPFIIAFGQAITTFTSQNYGAGNLKRCFEVVRKGLKLNFIFICILTGIVFLVTRPFLEFFGLNEEAMELGTVRIHYIVGFYFISTIYESLSASMRGFGNSLPPAIAMLVSIVGSRLLWIYTVYAANPTFRNIMYCYPVSWIVADVLIGALFWKTMKKYKTNASA